MAFVTSYFSRVSAEEHQNTLFKNREYAKKPEKRPLGRPRKRKRDDHNSKVQSHESVVSVDNGATEESSQPSSINSEEHSTEKSLRCQYTSNQKNRVVQYARQHGVRPTQRKYNIPRKNIQ